MANDDRFRNSYDPTQSGRNGYIAEPSDTDELPVMPRQLLMLTDGDLEFVFAGYDDQENPTVADNKIGPFPVVAGMTFNYAARYLTTGTTAQVLVVY